MENQESRAGKPEERGRHTDRKGPPRQRGDAGAERAGSQRQQEPRRRRATEQKYAGWGDGIERACCTRAAHDLPTAFPVETHAGAATIPRAVVARREGAVLLCTYSHLGPHVWPDGEMVDGDHE